MSKRLDAPYISGRGESWLKTKCVKSDEFIIIGYLRGNTHELGALLLDAYENKTLRYMGRVGTGFSAKVKNDLIKKFQPLLQKKPTVKEYPTEFEKLVWLKPKLIAEVEYLERTPEHLIRHGSFQRLREDKNLSEIEIHQPAKEKKTSHYLFPKQKLTRQDIKDYYQKAQSLLFPHLKNRPRNLFICHGDIHSRCYHLRRSETPELDQVKTIRKPNGHYLMLLENPEGLKTLLDKGVVEFHTWGSRLPHLENPDMMVFDLDASAEVSLGEIQNCALELKKILQELNLKSFLKTSGGKGYHLHVPIKPLYSWRQINDFCQGIARLM